MEGKGHRRLTVPGAQARHHARRLFGRHLGQHHGLIGDNPPLELRHLRGIDPRIKPSKHPPARQPARQRKGRKLQRDPEKRAGLHEGSAQLQHEHPDQQSDHRRPQRPPSRGDTVLIHAHLTGARTMHRRRPAKTVAPEVLQCGPAGLLTLKKANHQRAACSAFREFHMTFSS